MSLVNVTVAIEGALVYGLGAHESTCTPLAPSLLTVDIVYARVFGCEVFRCVCTLCEGILTENCPPTFCGDITSTTIHICIIEIYHSIFVDNGISTYFIPTPRLPQLVCACFLHYIMITEFTALHDPESKVQSTVKEIFIYRLWISILQSNPHGGCAVS